MNMGKTVGVLVFAGATAAIWMWPQAEAPEVPETLVRPVRTYVVKDASAAPEVRFAGVVKADASRTLRFKQQGRIQRIPVSKGQKVKKGEKLAWLFPEDFRNRLQNAEATAERDRLSYKRISTAAAKNAVSKEDLSRASAQLRTSEANLELAKRALEETEILAPFDGTVADVPGTELDIASPSYPVVVLQDMSKIKIEVAVPETIVIMQKKICHPKNADPDASCQVKAVFDSCPGRIFPAVFREYTAKADEKTQTYSATYAMDPVEDLLVLPGMSATIVIPAGSYSIASSTGERVGVDIPESAVGVDAKGGYFVWKIVLEGEAYVARRTEIRGCTHQGREMSVLEGVKPGDRLATAGVNFLTEGQSVTLFKE